MSETENYRNQFLLQLYNQLWNSVNARLSLTWESISILIGAFAIFALIEKQILSMSLAASVIILLSAWFLAHILDMSFWFNRNLVMISNIEREFLNVEDARLLYSYFLSHPKDNKMVYYLRIQASLGIGLALIVTLIHFSTDILPLFCNKAQFGFELVIPYIIIIAAAIFLSLLKAKRRSQYAEFINTSPGKDVREEATKAGLAHLL